jgi:pSer/pThr/pTyr-binding forkhead associated (FHA) protein
MRHKSLDDQKESNFALNHNSSDQGVKILVYEDLNLVGQYLFSHTTILIGKGRDADLCLEDPHISDIQAIVHIQNGNIIISDRSEKLGVYLNNKPVKAAVLEPFDLIEIGKYGLKLQVINSCNKKVNGNTHGSIPASNRSLLPLRCSKNNSRAKNFKQNSYLSEDFFALPPPYRSRKPSHLKGDKPNVLKSLSKASSKRFNLWFSGELKSGWTLLKVKKYLNRQFGIDYRKLTRFIRGKQIILKRNLTYLKAMKLYKAFESSGAICFVEPAKEPSPVINEEEHNPNIDPIISKKKSSHGKSEEMASIFKGSSHLNSNDKNSLEKTTQQQKNRSSAMLATIRKSGIFSGSENESSSMHRRLKAQSS